MRSADGDPAPRSGPTPQTALSVSVLLTLIGDPLFAPIVRLMPSVVHGPIWAHAVAITAMLNCVALTLGAFGLGTIVQRGQADPAG